MASKNYTISMPEEIMAMLDEMAKREHRSRSEMVRAIILDYAKVHQTYDHDVLGALYERFAPFREATAHMSQQEVYDLIDGAISEVRDQNRAGHQRATKSDRTSRRALRKVAAATP